MSPQDDVTRPTAAAMLAHELRSPLASIVSVAEVMASEALGPLPSPYLAYAHLICDSGRHLLELVAALLAADPARDDTRQDPVRLAADAITLIGPSADAAGVRRVLAAPETVEPLGVAVRPFRQILSNLLDNALKATGPGGLVEVRLEVDGSHLTLEVRDSGGRPFETGSGLGHSIVRALCAAQDGAFDFQATGAGATAKVRVPLDAT